MAAVTNMTLTWPGQRSFDGAGILLEDTCAYFVSSNGCAFLQLFNHVVASATRSSLKKYPCM